LKFMAAILDAIGPENLQIEHEYRRGATQPARGSTSHPKIEVAIDLSAGRTFMSGAAK